MKLKNRSNWNVTREERFNCSPGDPIVHTFNEIEEDGTTKLVPAGDYSLQELIESSSSGILVYDLIKKYRDTGDVGVLNRRAPGAYVDTTNMPTTLLQAQQLAEKSVAAINEKTKGAIEAAEKAAAQKKVKEEDGKEE